MTAKAYVMLMALFLPVVLYACSEQSSISLPSTTTSSTGTTSTTTSTSTTTTTTLALISGPSVGSSGNDADQVFRSLTAGPNDPNLIYVGSEGNGIFKSTDGGSNWSWLRSGLRYLSVPSYPEIWEIAIDKNDTSKIYAATVSGGNGPLSGDYPSATGGPYKSDNSGESFSQNNSDLDNAYSSTIAMDPQNSSVLYLGIGGGTTSFGLTGYFPSSIFKSTNSGESWTKIYTAEPSGSSTNQFWQIIPWDSQKIFALGLNFLNTLEAVGIIKSTDAGQNWGAVTSPSGVHVTHFDVSRQDKNFIYAQERGKNNAYKTINGGSTWESFLDVPFSGFLKISPHNKQTAFFTKAYFLFKTADGLSTYTIVLTPEGMVDDVEFTSDPNVIYVGGRGLLIYKSTDGGNTFSLIKNLRNFINSQ